MMMTGNDKQQAHDLAIALEQCASEPVHIPGSIQPHGCLLVFDEAHRHILQCSDNLHDIIGIRPSELLGASTLPQSALLTSLIECLNGLQTIESVQTRQLTLPSGTQEQSFHLSSWRCDTGRVVELQAIPASPPSHWVDSLSHWSLQLESCNDQKTLLQVLTDAIRVLSRYDRVMVYRFDSDWNGQVISESRRADVDGYLGHHFPASDIPPQVRRLYHINPLRVIVDSQAEASPLLATPGSETPAPLDLSPGLLRGVSPIHQTYLQNMGVRASFSIALFSRGQLWGLVACHHGQHRPADPDSLLAANVLVRLASQRRELLQYEAQAEFFRRVLRNRRLLLQGNRQSSPQQLIEHHGKTWLQLFRACGGALIYEDQGLQSWQDTPDAPVIAEIIKQLQAKASRHIPWYSDCLEDSELSIDGSLNGHAGLLALPLVSARSSNSWLLFFRRELLQFHQWAGPLKDQPSYVDGKPVLTPRQSFSSWQQRVEGKSESWREVEIRAAQELAENLSTALTFHEINRLNNQLSKVNEQLQTMVRTDPLTGIWNRYYIQEELIRLTEAARRYNHPFSVIFFDIDRFKDFNDQHGHQAGDRVLRSISECLQSRLRSADVLGRWGGEEFIIVAGNTEQTEAVQLAERVREAVAELDLGELGHVTISLGVTQWREDEDGNSLVNRADEAMYQAKADGRNRVAVPADEA